MQNSFKISLSFIFLLFLLSCKGNDEGDWFSGDFYNTDTSKLAEEIIDQSLGTKFNPPANWLIQSAELSRKIETKNSFHDSPQNRFEYSPQYLFFNQSGGSLLSVGYVEYSDSSLNSELSFNNYKNLLGNKLRNDKISIASFTKSGIKFFQIKSEKEDLINFKILYLNQNSKIIQFDCTIRRENLESEMESLKSTIGSIQLVR